jgi:hypothetical protein
VGDERAETYLRLLAEAELRRVGEQIRRVDAVAGIGARSREGMSLFGSTELAQWKVVRTARILVAAGVLGDSLHGAVRGRLRRDSCLAGCHPAFTRAPAPGDWT